MKTLFVYHLPPIDFWVGWKKEEDFIRDELDDVEFLAEYKQRKANAMVVAKEIGWEGDMREGPFIAGLPEDCEYMIAWKQDNNGNCFVATPHRLRWLEKNVIAMDNA